MDIKNLLEQHKTAEQDIFEYFNVGHDLSFHSYMSIDNWLDIKEWHIRKGFLYYIDYDSEEYELKILKVYSKGDYTAAQVKVKDGHGYQLIVLDNKYETKMEN